MLASLVILALSASALAAKEERAATRGPRSRSARPTLAEFARRHGIKIELTETLGARGRGKFTANLSAHPGTVEVTVASAPVLGLKGKGSTPLAAVNDLTKTFKAMRANYRDVSATIHGWVNGVGLVEIARAIPIELRLTRGMKELPLDVITPKTIPPAPTWMQHWPEASP